jgi:glucose/arabinose dehydrogenase
MIGQPRLAPLLSWDVAAPPGGASVYTGTRLRGWRGDLVVATLGSRHLHRVELAEGLPARVSRHAVYLDPPGGPGRMREAIMGPDGELYVTTSNCDGRGDCPPERDRVLRIVPADEPPAE